MSEADQADLLGGLDPNIVAGLVVGSVLTLSLILLSQVGYGCAFIIVVIPICHKMKPTTNAGALLIIAIIKFRPFTHYCCQETG